MLNYHKLQRTSMYPAMTTCHYEAGPNLTHQPWPDSSQAAISHRLCQVALNRSKEAQFQLAVSHLPHSLGGRLGMCIWEWAGGLPFFAQRLLLSPKSQGHKLGVAFRLHRLLAYSQEKSAASRFGRSRCFSFGKRAKDKFVVETLECAKQSHPFPRWILMRLHPVDSGLWPEIPLMRLAIMMTELRALTPQPSKPVVTLCGCTWKLISPAPLFATRCA